MNAPPRPRLVVLCGPTAAGKSALALALARRLGARIVVADSRQVYRGMDVGTAKAPASVRAEVVHHGVDVVEPGEPFDAARFRALAADAIQRAQDDGVPIIVEGGTGLYLRALLRGFMELPGRDDAFRAALAEEAAAVGWPALHARLAAVDADYAARIAATDPVRITRALEIFHHTGTPMSVHERAHAFADAPYEVMGLLVDADRAVHDARITARVEEMWKHGLLEETRALRQRLPDDHPLLGTINYAQAVDHLDGKVDARAARAEMALKTRQFAKRQRTWFRKEPWATPWDGSDVTRAVEAFLRRKD